MSATIIFDAAFLALTCTVGIVGFAWIVRFMGFWLVPPFLSNPWLWLLIWVCFFGAFLPTFAAAAELPSDPVQRVAEKALGGDFGELEWWQATAYRLLAENGPAREGRAYVTHYTPPHFKRGQGTRWGWGCTEGCYAANKLPGYWYVLVQHPGTGFWEMGWIRDTGASWNDAHWKRKARRIGITVDIWLDRWHPSPAMGNDSWQGAKYYAISAQKTW